MILISLDTFLRGFVGDFWGDFWRISGGVLEGF